MLKEFLKRCYSSQSKGFYTKREAKDYICIFKLKSQRQTDNGKKYPTNSSQNITWETKDLPVRHIYIYINI